MGTSFSSTDYAFNANVSLPANAALGIFSAQAYSTTYGTGGDDTAAVQAALNAATAAGGAVAFLPPPTSGYVNISSPLVLGNNGTCLVGASPAVKIKVKAGSNLDWAISTAVETSVDYRTNFVVNTHAVTLGGNTYNLYNAASPVALSTGGGIYNIGLVGDSTQVTGLGHGVMLNAASGFVISNFSASGFIGEEISLWDCVNVVVSSLTIAGSPSVAVHRACYDISIVTAGVSASGSTPFRVYAEQYTVASVTTTYSPAYTKFVDCHAFTATTLAEAFDLAGAAYVNLTGCTGDGFTNVIGSSTRYSLPCYQVLSDVGALSGVASVSGTSPVVSSGGTNPAISLVGLTGLGTAGQVPTVNPGATALQWSTPAGGTTSVTAPITNSGTGQNPNIGLTNPLPTANGGTGLTAPGTSGNVLTSTGSAWASTAPAPTTTPYDSVVLAQSPTHYWALNDASGSTTAADTGSSNNPLTQQGTVTFGAPGLALDGETSVAFPGTPSNYLQMPLAAVPSGNFSLTLILLSTNSTTSSGDQQFCAFDQGGGTIVAGAFVGKIHANVFSYAADNNANYTGTCPASTAKAHLAYVYTSSSGLMQVYVNGVLTYTNTAALTTSTVAGSFGACPANVTSSFQGRMAKIGLWNGLLTQAQIFAQVKAAGL